MTAKLRRSFFTRLQPLAGGHYLAEQTPQAVLKELKRFLG
jgi:hypothetical protein